VLDKNLVVRYNVITKRKGDKTMLYRIDREFDDYRHGEWETEHYYQYVCGLRNVGKACLDANESDRVVEVVRLNFSIKGLIVCLKKTCSLYKNKTSK
jgi:hypothetical protein